MRLKVVGWGPFPIWGEKKRWARAQAEATETMAILASLDAETAARQQGKERAEHRAHNRRALRRVSRTDLRIGSGQRMAQHSREAVKP